MKIVPSGPYRDADRNSAIRKLDQFLSRKEHGEFVRESTALLFAAAPEHIPDEQLFALMRSPAAMQAIQPFLCYDATLESGETVVQLFLRTRASKLNAGERAFLTRAAQSHTRLYEIVEVRPNEGLRVRDLLTGNEQFVRERAATTQVTTWEIMAARVMEGPDGGPMFDAISAVFSPLLKEAALETLRAARREALHAGVTSECDFFRAFASAIQGMWMHQAFSNSDQVITTTDGDDLAFVHAIFDVYAEKRVRAALKASKAIVAESEDSFVWLDDDGERVLGSFRFNGKRLQFDGLSERRGVQAREFLERIAGDAVLYRMTSVESLEKRMELAPSKREDADNRSAMQPEEQHEVARAFYEEHYRKWVDVPLPALGDRTPRRAAKLKTWRPVLEALLRDLEGMIEKDRRAGRIAPDISWMWGELGLDRGAVAPPVIDPRPPAERIAALITERTQGRRRAILDEMEAEVSGSGSAHRWIAAIAELEATGDLSVDLSCFLSFKLAEAVTPHWMDHDVELVRLEEEMQSIERAHGLREDEHWLVAEAPPDWRALSAAWDSRNDTLIATELRNGGRSDFADQFVKEEHGFHERLEAGWMEFLKKKRRKIGPTVTPRR